MREHHQESSFGLEMLPFNLCQDEDMKLARWEKISQKKNYFSML